ncbi:MAG: hypothetical protein NC420_11705 [Eubacterium sp.]|nr:hypothetical protein [Eubacterium sp.]
MADKYDSLKLENQICFPLYVCAKEVGKHLYLDSSALTPLLSRRDLGLVLQWICKRRRICTVCFTN